MIKIAPSLLAIETQTIEEIIASLPKITAADYLHIDVMDGQFVRQNTIYLDSERTRQISEATDTPLDVHLMVQFPEYYVFQFADAGADIITFHYEAKSELSPQRLAQLIQNRGVKAGIAINPDTATINLKPILPFVDLVLLMSVVPGKCGQGYIPETTEKIKSLKRYLIEQKKEDVIIEVDGGIKPENTYLSTNAGANMLVSGSGIFSTEESNQLIKRMRDVILIGSDHGGLRLKEAIKGYLNENNRAFYDVGTDTDDSCDYADIAKRVAGPISQRINNQGVLICGTGQGMSMAANNFKRVRAGVISNPYDAKMIKRHNAANILCLGERTLENLYKSDSTQRGIEFFKIWDETARPTEERHLRRISKIDYL